MTVPNLELSYLHGAILRSLADHGGRMNTVDLLSEVARPNTGRDEVVVAVREMVGAGLISGPPAACMPRMS